MSLPAKKTLINIIKMVFSIIRFLFEWLLSFQPLRVLICLFFGIVSMIWITDKFSLSNVSSFIHVIILFTSGFGLYILLFYLFPIKKKDLYTDIKDYSGLADVKTLKNKLNNGFSLGKNHGNLLCLPKKYLLQHACVFAPSGSGKTESYVIPWATEAITMKTSVILIDVKGDLIDRLGSYCTEKRVKLCYLNPDDNRSMKNNFLQEIQNERDINTVVDAIHGNQKIESPSDEHFKGKDKRHLSALIRLGLEVLKNNFTPYYLYKMAVNEDYIQGLIKKSKDKTIEDDLSDVFKGEKYSYSEQMGGIANKLYMFRDANIRKITEETEYNLDDIFEHPTVFILGAPLSYGEPSATLSAIYIRLLQAKLYKRFKGWKIPVYFLLDEFKRLRINGEEFLSVCRSAGAGVVSILQDIDQLPEDIRETFLNNCATLIALYGCGSKAADWLSNKFGRRRTGKISQNDSTSSSGFMNSSASQGISISQEYIPVLEPREIMYPIHDRIATVHCRLANEKPFIVDTTRNDLLPEVVWNKDFNDALNELDNELDNEIQGKNRDGLPEITLKKEEQEQERKLTDINMTKNDTESSKRKRRG